MRRVCDQCGGSPAPYVCQECYERFCMVCAREGMHRGTVSPRVVPWGAVDFDVQADILSSLGVRRVRRRGVANG